MQTLNDKFICRLQCSVVFYLAGWNLRCFSPGPFFVVNHPQVEHYRSEVFDGVKKGDSSLLMVLRQPLIVCGDVMIEFFNKQKMMAKVSSVFLRVIIPICKFIILATAVSCTIFLMSSATKMFFALGFFRVLRVFTKNKASILIVCCRCFFFQVSLTILLQHKCGLSFAVDTGYLSCDS